MPSLKFGLHSLHGWQRSSDWERVKKDVCSISSNPINILNTSIRSIRLPKNTEIHGDVTTNVNCRLGKAAAVFQRMRSIWTSSVDISSTKIWLCEAIVLFVATYACDTWKITAKIAHKLNLFHQQCLRKLLRVTYLYHITNEEVLKRAGSTRLQDIVAECRFHLTGHILHLSDHRHSKTAVRWAPAGGTCRRGRPKKTWRRIRHKKTWHGYIWHGMRRKSWLQTDHTGEKLLPNVLCSSGGSKSVTLMRSEHYRHTHSPMYMDWTDSYH